MSAAFKIWRELQATPEPGDPGEDSEGAGGASLLGSAVQGESLVQASREVPGE